MRVKGRRPRRREGQSDGCRCKQRLIHDRRPAAHAQQSSAEPWPPWPRTTLSDCRLCRLRSWAQIRQDSSGRARRAAGPASTRSLVAAAPARARCSLRTRTGPDGGGRGTEGHPPGHPPLRYSVARPQQRPRAVKESTLSRHR